MRRFLSTWLVFIIVAVFAAAMLICAPLLTSSAERAAQGDLNALLDAAFAHLDAAGMDADLVTSASENNILAKARATARFLAHDDALLQTDALVSLCELLEVSAIDVTDYAGVVIVSSVPGRTDRNLAQEPATAWTNEVLAGDFVERTHVSDAEPALLWGCVPRTDTDGFVLVQSLDTAIMAATASTDPELVLLDFSFINDELKIDSAPGTDRAYPDGSRYYVRRTQSLTGDRGEMALIASRSIGSVYVLRNVVLLVLSIVALSAVVCALVFQTMLMRRSHGRSHISMRQRPHLSPVQDDDPSSSEEDPPQSDPPEEPLPENGPMGAAAPEQAAPAEPVDTADEPKPKQTNRKKKPAAKPRKKIFEWVPIDDDAPVADPAPATGDSDTPDSSVAADEAGDSIALFDGPTQESSPMPEPAAEPAPAPEDASTAPEADPESAAPDAPGTPHPTAIRRKPSARRSRQAAASAAREAHLEQGFDQIFD